MGILCAGERESGVRKRTRERAATAGWSSLPCPLGTCGGQAKGAYWFQGCRLREPGSWRCALTVFAAVLSLLESSDWSTDLLPMKAEREASAVPASRSPCCTIPEATWGGRAPENRAWPGAEGYGVSPRLSWVGIERQSNTDWPLRFVSRELLPAPQGNRRGA